MSQMKESSNHVVEQYTIVWHVNKGQATHSSGEVS